MVWNWVQWRWAVSTPLTAELRELPVCFQCQLDGWLCPRHSRLSPLIKARMQRRDRTCWWAGCMEEAFSVDAGHARRCTQEDYLILIQAIWYNVIKHLTWEISSILIWEGTGGNYKVRRVFSKKGDEEERAIYWAQRGDGWERKKRKEPFQRTRKANGLEDKAQKKSEAAMSSTVPTKRSLSCGTKTHIHTNSM